METMKIVYNSSLNDVRELNSSFDIGTLQICYTGANRNKTYFSKQALERAIPSIFNCPVVARYYRDGSLGGHDVEVIRDYDDEVRLVNLTQPVGVIPESAEITFRDVVEEDGTTHTYLCASVILWKRQEAYKAIKENGITQQSMEISVKDGQEVDGLYIIDDFEFTAFALLGNDIEPCFESASLQVYSNFGSEFKNEFKQMMNEIRETFHLATTPEDGVDTQDSDQKGGSCYMVDETNKTEEVFESNEKVDEVAEEQVEEVIDEVFEANDESEEVQEENFALNSNLQEAICAAFVGQTMMTEWGEIPKYHICDYDTEAMMIYAWDQSDWLLYGFEYKMDGDNVVIDFSEKKRMKYIIAEFDEGETQDSPFASTYEKISESVKETKENVSDLETKYQNASEQINEMTTELNELRKFKSDVENATDKAQRDELLAQFSDLNDVEEYVALVNDSSAYDLEALEEKCYALRGRNMKLNFSKNEVKAPKLPVIPNEDKDEKEPYGGAVKRYLKK